jgi:hypothetical protein
LTSAVVRCLCNWISNEATRSGSGGVHGLRGERWYVTAGDRFIPWIGRARVDLQSACHEAARGAPMEGACQGAERETMSDER